VAEEGNEVVVLLPAEEVVDFTAVNATITHTRVSKMIRRRRSHYPIIVII